MMKSRWNIFIFFQIFTDITSIYSNFDDIFPMYRLYFYNNYIINDSDIFYFIN